MAGHPQASRRTAPGAQRPDHREAGLENFRYDRNRLLEDLGREARRVVNTFDKERESKAIAESALNTVAASAAMEAGALGWERW